MSVLETPGHQSLAIEVDFSTRTLKGWTEITILPTDASLKIVSLNCRQCTITKVTVNNKGPTIKHFEPYSNFRLHETADVHQHHQKRQKLEPCLAEHLEGDLFVTLPRNVKVELQDPFALAAGNALSFRGVGSQMKADSPGPSAIGTPTPAITSKLDGSAAYTPIIVRIEFAMREFREGFHFVGADDDPRYPHAYTLNDVLPGSACSLFPTIDSLWQRHTWDIEITCPRTLRDIKVLKQTVKKTTVNSGGEEIYQRFNPKRDDSDFAFEYRGEDEELEMMVSCSGQFLSESVDAKDPGKKISHFRIGTATTPHHIAFAIGPFEKIDLTSFREADDVELLGGNAVDMYAFCLPKREEGVRNTCIFMHMAVDFFVQTYGKYPYESFSLCFVDDFAYPAIPSASLAVCSNRLLFSQDMIDPIYSTTRTLTWALASQWSGVSIIPKEWQDLWVVIGIAYYITGIFLKKLTGNNEYRFRLKLDADRLCELDIGRKSLIWHSWELPLSPADFDFISLKSPMILYILDRRLTKASGSLGLSRVIPRIFLQAYDGTLNNCALSTAHFQRQCEKMGHTKLENFFQQWVHGAGYPRFEISQRFNKKKLIVEMIIRQLQVADGIQRKVTPETFLHEAKEHKEGLPFADEPQMFTGPMTIRLHEADGTPYEHVVEIKDSYTKLEIPYMTKYKRIKRTKRNKERLAVTAAMDVSLDAPAEDILLYCLGDVLQNEEDMVDWKLVEWSKEEEDRMAQEAFEWIRVDADFEWICKLTINQPDHMFLSQLQQDRDVVAQYESIKHFASVQGSGVISSILVRTLMDRRYYYGIRTEAAKVLTKSATQELGWIGRFHLQKAFQEFYCFPDSVLPRGNDFSDFTSYFVQCAIVKALGSIREVSGLSPVSVQQFLLDLLRYNDNSNNTFADHHYMATLMSALGNCTVAGTSNDYGIDFEYDEEDRIDTRNAIISELERIQRMDKFMPSYQNTITHTALTIKKDLMLSKIIKPDLREFVEYIREGTCEFLRLRAFECLVELGGIRHPSVVRIICGVIGHDPSPFMRKNVSLVFLTGLGAIALGQDDKPVAERAADEMIIEDNAVARRHEDATQDIAFALSTFVAELSQKEDLKEAMWSAISSTTLGVVETRNLTDVCALLYEPKQSLIVKLKLRKARRLIAKKSGKGIFTFIWDPTSLQVASFLPTPAPTPPAQPKVSLLLKPPTQAAQSVKIKKEKSPPRTVKVKKEKVSKPKLIAKSASPAPLPPTTTIAADSPPPQQPKLKIKFKAAFLQNASLATGIPSPDDVF